MANPKVMGNFAATSPLLRVLGWLATGIMAVASAGMFITWKS
jgi:hypothetical protein